MTRVAALACLLMIAGCRRGGTSGALTEGTDWAARCDGDLVLSVPELPSDLQAAPSGGVLVVDRGGLALRDERDFQVLRYLAPGIDGWHRGEFSADGGSWRGETFDGQRYDVDVKSGVATRLYDARVSKDERELRERSFDPDSDHAFEEAKRVASALVTAELERARVPVELVPELEATAALVLGSSLLLADGTGVLWNIDLAAKTVKLKASCPLCSPKVALVSTSMGVVAIDRAGVATLLSDKLEPLREGDLRPLVPGNEEVLLVTRVLSVGGATRIAWLASDGQHGLFDLQSFTSRDHERPLGLAGVTDVSFWGDDRVAFAAQGAVEVRGIPSGKVLQRRAGNFVSVVGLPEGELLGIRPDGVAYSLSETTPPRCVTPVCPVGGSGNERARLLSEYQTAMGSALLDEADRAALRQKYEGLAASRRFAHALSPDGTHVAFVGWARDVDVPGVLTVYEVEDWKLVLSEVIGRQHAPAAPRWEADGSLTVSSVKFTVRGVGAAPGRIELERKSSADGGYDWLILAKGSEAVVVSDQVAGRERKAALRRGSSFDLSPDGRGYVIAGGDGAPAPSGPLSVFCAPVSKPVAKLPPPLEVPAVAELEGVLEIALEELPPRYESLAAEPDGTAWVLTVGEEGRRLLGRLTPDATKAEVTELPSAAQFTRVVFSGDGSLWALSGAELARRSPDGSWTTVPLGVDGEFKQAVGLPSGGIAGVVEAKTGEREVIVMGAELVRRPVKFTRELPPLIALPNGVLMPADPKCTAPGPCDRGFVVRDGKVDTKDPLIALVSARKPLNGWLRGTKLLLLGQKWVSVELASGKVTEELSPQAVFKKRKHAVGPRPAPTPYLDSLEVELIRFVDRDGRPLALAALRGPAWIPEIAQAFDAADTRPGTWARKGTLSVMFWDGRKLRAYFHPDTRSRRLKEMQ